MKNRLIKKILFLYDEQAKVWIAQVLENEGLEGIVLEDSSFTILAQRLELAINDLLED